MLVAIVFVLTVRTNRTSTHRCGYVL